MSAFVTDAGDGGLPLTGERTVPGVAVENYWFRRHEVVYARLAQLCAGRDMLEAGCGEGYGADLIASVARTVIAVDYDYIPAYGLKILAGRPFDRNFGEKDGVIFNRTALRQLGFDKPDEAVGKKIEFWGDQLDLVGVVEDVAVIAV